MQKSTFHWNNLGVKAELSQFISNANETQDGVSEFHVMLHVETRGEHFDKQLDRAFQAEMLLLESEPLKEASIVFKRYFLSNASEQQPLIEEHRNKIGNNCSAFNNNIAISMIQQPPLDGTEMAIWLYLVQNAEVSKTNSFTVVAHNGYKHLYQWGLIEPAGDSYHQTKELLERYESALQNEGASLEKNCIRTWFYVRDVDNQYAGLVKARRENFIEQGLTEKTHYITSTGIGGAPADARAIVQLGTYALLGFEPSQQRYLYAPTHLNPTYEYGVTFERGTVMEYGDRRHVLISGTASINNKGEVMYVGDIARQTDRMIENVEVLLAEGGSSFSDVMQVVVYLRNADDYSVVKEKYDNHPLLRDIPKVFTLAPVCRPTWLVEMECIAIKEQKNALYRNF